MNIGERSEIRVLGKLIDLGFKVSIPLGHEQPYDLVAEKFNKVYLIQCKTARLKNKMIRFESGKPKVSYKTQIDYFGLFCPENQNVYFIDPEICGKRKTSLYVDKFKRRGNQKTVKPHQEYKAENVVFEKKGR